MRKTTQELIMLEDAFEDNCALAMEINGSTVRYFLQSNGSFVSCLIAVGIYNSDWRDEQHVQAIKNTLGEEKLETYLKKIKTLRNFLLKNIRV